MMLSDYPLVLNNIELLIPASYNESWNPIEVVKQSAAGTDIYTNVRDCKLNISVSYKVTSTWLKTLSQLNMTSRTQSLTLKRYDPILETYSEHSVKMKGFNYQTERKAYDLAITNGIYKVSFTLEEI